MPVPLVGIGHGLTLSQLVEFVVEPGIPFGVTFAQRDKGSDNSIHLQGRHCRLPWEVFESIEDMQAQLAQLGLTEGVTRAAVTVYLPTDDGYWHVYDAWAEKPATIRYQLWPQGIEVLLTEMVLTDAGVE
jgi:hypothetical protein